MKRAILGLALLLVAASWPSQTVAQDAAARWVEIRFGVATASTVCQLNFEHAYCLVRTRFPATPAAVIVDCLQEHLPGHYRCVVMATF